MFAAATSGNRWSLRDRWSSAWSAPTKKRRDHEISESSGEPQVGKARSFPEPRTNFDGTDVALSHQVETQCHASSRFTASFSPGLWSNSLSWIRHCGATHGRRKDTSSEY